MKKVLKMLQLRYSVSLQTAVLYFGIMKRLLEFKCLCHSVLRITGHASAVPFFSITIETASADITAVAAWSLTNILFNLQVSHLFKQNVMGLVVSS